MDHQPIPAGRSRWQLGLGDLLLGVLFVASACAAAKYLVVGIDRDIGRDGMWLDFVLALSGFLVPGLLCGGIGILRRRRRFWFTYAIALDAAIAFGLFLLLNAAR